MIIEVFAIKGVVMETFAIIGIVAVCLSVAGLFLYFAKKIFDEMLDVFLKAALLPTSQENKVYGVKAPKGRDENKKEIQQTIKDKIQEIKNLHEKIIALESVMECFEKSKDEEKFPFDYINIKIEGRTLMETIDLKYYPILKIDTIKIKNTLIVLLEKFNTWGGIEKLNKVKEIEQVLHSILYMIFRKNDELIADNNSVLFYKNLKQISISNEYITLEAPSREQLIKDYEGLRKKLFILLDLNFYESGLDKIT